MEIILASSYDSSYCDRPPQEAHINANINLHHPVLISHSSRILSTCTPLSLPPTPPPLTVCRSLLRYLHLPVPHQSSSRQNSQIVNCGTNKKRNRNKKNRLPPVAKQQPIVKQQLLVKRRERKTYFLRRSKEPNASTTSPRKKEKQSLTSCNASQADPSAMAVRQQKICTYKLRRTRQGRLAIAIARRGKPNTYLLNGKRRKEGEHPLASSRHG